MERWMVISHPDPTGKDEFHYTVSLVEEDAGTFRFLEYITTETDEEDNHIAVKNTEQGQVMAKVPAREFAEFLLEESIRNNLVYSYVEKKNV